MKTFHVLFIDDEKAQLTQLEDLEDEFDGLIIDYAASQKAALDLIAQNFYHLAIVDVSLRGKAREDTDGLFILERLREVRPYCERLLHTTVANEDRREVLKALAPRLGDDQRLAHGYVDKADPHLRAREIIGDRARRWLERPVAVVGGENVLEHIAGRQIEGVGLSNRHGRIQPNQGEVDSVLAELFGQGRAHTRLGVDSIDEVDLQLISEGWSKSVVLWCEPSLKDRTGPRCLIKVGPRTDSVQEVERYESFVRYGLGLNYRVELLASVVGDTIGAACYTHFEARGDTQYDLQHFFNEESPVALEAIELLLSPDSQFFTAVPSTERDLARFFQDEYNRPIKDLLGRLEEFVGGQDDLAIGLDRSSVSWNETSIPIPCREDMGLAAFSGSYGACLVHGDLHGGNVLVTANGQPVLIDYRNMGRGPRLLDFVSLEVSLRMSANSVAEVDDVGPGLFEREHQVWNDTWSGDHALDGRPFWEQASLTIRRLAIENHPDATEVEYAAAALLRTLRVMSAFAPQDKHRLRLLPFLSMLTKVIREFDDG